MKHLAVILSDLHIHNYKQFNEGTRRLDDCLRVLEDVGSFCERNGITTIFFVGDLFDSQKLLPTEVVNRTVDAFISFFKKYDIDWYALSGNHDHATKNLVDKPAVSALQHISTICDRFWIVDNEVVTVGEGTGITVSGVPYYEYKEHFDTQLDKVMEYRGSNRNYLMIHQTPRGIGNEMIPYEVEPKDARFDNYDHVFCGHIHARVQLTEKFTVVGNPIHRDLADAGKQKGFLVMNLHKPEKGHKFIPLKGYPEFKEMYDDEEVSEEDRNNFIVKKPRVDVLKGSETAKAEEFSTDLSSQVLLENYWKEVDGKDEKLLQVGLSFLK